MSQRQIDRRQLLALGATGAVGAWSGVITTSAAAQSPPPDDNIPFSVDIPGCPDASKNIREISVDELNIDARETKAQDDGDVEIIQAGRVHHGSAKITCTRKGGSKELQLWFQEAAKGKGIRKNLTVTLHKSDKSDGRSYSLMDCFPTQWSSVNFDTSSTVQTETLTVSVGRIEFKT